MARQYGRNQAATGDRRVQWKRLIATVVICLLVAAAGVGYRLYDQSVNGVRIADTLGDSAQASTRAIGTSC